MLLEGLLLKGVSVAIGYVIGVGIGVVINKSIDTCLHKNISEGNPSTTM
jgi:hypothetical protein